MGNVVIFRGDEALNLKSKFANRVGSFEGTMDFSGITGNRTYTMPNVTGEVVLTTGGQIITGDKVFSGQISFNRATDQVRIGQLQEIIINVSGLAADRTISFVDPLTDANFVLSEGTQTLGGTYTFSNTIVGSISGNAGTVTNGVYTTGAQTIAGVKTFSNTIVGSISGNAGTVTNGAYVNVANTFTQAQTITASSNQVVLSSGVNELTLNSGTSAAARTYTVPDVGTTANFVMTAGDQSIAGEKTFTGETIFSAGTPEFRLLTGTDVGGYFGFLQFGDGSNGMVLGHGSATRNFRLQTGAGDVITMAGDGSVTIAPDPGTSARSNMLVGDGGGVKIYRYATTNGNTCLILSRTTTVSGGEVYLNFYENGSSVVSEGTDAGGIRRNSGDTAWEFFSLSDATLKDVGIDMSGALDIVSGISVKNYKWKKKEKRKDKDTFGFIAQDVQKFLPECVAEDDNGMLNLGKSHMFDVLWQAVRELKSELDAMKAS